MRRNTLQCRSVNFIISSEANKRDIILAYFVAMRHVSICLWSKSDAVLIYIFSRVHATLQPALYVGRSVGRSVGWLVTLYFFYSFYSYLIIISQLGHLKSN